MPRRTKEEAEKTRARILASALSLFVRKGYEHTTFTDIAARLKLTKGAVYWHFASKEALLIALVEEMLAKFERQLDELMPKDELSFPAVAEMMVANAERILGDPRGTAFFMLMKTQVKWTDSSMDETRERLMANATNGPYHTFVRAVENDIAAGRVGGEVDPKGVAAVAISVWDGLVRARIDRFLECDLAATMRHAYDGIWRSIAAGGRRGGRRISNGGKQNGAGK